MKSSFLVIAVLLASTLVAQQWQTYLIKSGSARNTGIAIDQQKCPHIFYYSPQLYSQFTNHSYWNGEEWIHEIIGTAAIIHNDGPSAICDSQGKLHVVYFNGDHQLQYALFDESWQTVIVDGEFNTGDWCQIKLDAMDRPHIIYSQTSDFVTRYATQMNGTWEITQLPGNGGIGVNILIDDDGKIHTIDNQSGNGIRYSVFDGLNWNYESAVAPASQYNSLTLDLSGKPHISYYLAQGGNFDLFISIKEGNSWPTFLVDHGLQQSKRGWDNHLATAENGTIHIIYLAHNELEVRHAWGNNDQWSVEVVDMVGMYNSGIEVAMDGNNLYTSYYDEDTQEVRLSTLAGDFTPPDNLFYEVFDTDIHLHFEHISKYSLVVPDYFRIYRNGYLLDEIPGNIFEYVDLDLTPGTYTYYVTASYGLYNESEPSNEVTVMGYPVVEMPSFNPEPGIFTDSVIVEIYCPTPGAEIRYTCDGSQPDENSTLYDLPLHFDTTTLLKARGFLTGMISSQTNTGTFVIDYSTKISGRPALVEKSLHCSPNPFSYDSKIEYRLNKISFVTCEILNSSGNSVVKLWEGKKPAGSHALYWNGKGSNGIPVTPGIYICLLNVDGFNEETKLIYQR
jgi:hypothetical protein